MAHLACSQSASGAAIVIEGRFHSLHYTESTQSAPGFQDEARSVDTVGPVSTSTGVDVPLRSCPLGGFPSDGRERRALDVRVSVSIRCSARTAARARCMGCEYWSSIAFRRSRRQSGTTHTY